MKGHRFCSSFCPAESSAPVNHPGCAWKRLRWSAGVGDISSEFITVQSLYKGSHSTLALYFHPWKSLIPWPIWYIVGAFMEYSNETTVNQLFTQRKRGRYLGQLKKKKERNNPKLKFALILCGIFHPVRAPFGWELMETLFWQLKEYLWVDELPTMWILNQEKSVFFSLFPLKPNTCQLQESI